MIYTEIKELDDSSFKSEIENSRGDLLVDFYASWCMPCKMLAPVIEEIAREGVKVYKADTDRAGRTAYEYSVTSVPTVICFRNGKAAGRITGVCSKEDILDLIK